MGKRRIGIIQNDRQERKTWKEHDLETKKSYVISKDGKPGPVSTKLYNHLRGIQYGDEEDKHGWVTIVIE